MRWCKWGHSNELDMQWFSDLVRSALLPFHFTDEAWTERSWVTWPTSQLVRSSQSSLSAFASIILVLLVPVSSAQTEPFGTLHPLKILPSSTLSCPWNLWYFKWLYFWIINIIFWIINVAGKYMQGPCSPSPVLCLSCPMPRFHLAVPELHPL